MSNLELKIPLIIIMCLMLIPIFHILRFTLKMRFLIKTLGELDEVEKMGNRNFKLFYDEDMWICNIDTKEVEHGLIRTDYGESKYPDLAIFKAIKSAKESEG